MESCDHIAFLTNNCKRLEDFYIRKLDFVKEKEEILQKSYARTIFGVPSDCIFVRLFRGKLKIEIFQPISMCLSGLRGRSEGLNHWGLRVENRRKCAQKLRRRRVPVIEVKRNSRTVYFLRDPDCNLIEIRD